MRELEVDPNDRSMVLAHYYRAMVGRADVWRMRLDTTTNWAAGATAAVISFTLGSEGVPHYLIFIAAVMTYGFLQLEARRLTFYHLWQQRVLLLEEGLVRPALQAEGAAAAEPLGSNAPDEAVLPGNDLRAALDEHLGRTVPTMSHTKAVARRLRRAYLYLFGVQLLAWISKLANQPTSATSMKEIIARGEVWILPGGLVVAISLILFLGAMILAFGYGGVDRDPA